METVILELENVLAKLMLKVSNVMYVKIPSRVGHNAQIVKNYFNIKSISLHMLSHRM